MEGHSQEGVEGWVGRGGTCTLPALAPQVTLQGQEAEALPCSLNTVTATTAESSVFKLGAQLLATLAPGSGRTAAQPQRGQRPAGGGSGAGSYHSPSSPR